MSTPSRPPGLFALPYEVPVRAILAGLVLCIAMAVGTTVKLRRMAEMRGWSGTDERVVEQHVITSKRVDRSACWVAWQGGRARGWEDKAVQIPREQCGRWNEGDMIEVMRLGSDGAPFLEDDIYASDGNFVFDFMLLGLESTAVLLLSVVLIRRRSELRRGDLEAAKS